MRVNVTALSDYEARDFIEARQAAMRSIEIGAPVVIYNNQEINNMENKRKEDEMCTDADLRIEAVRLATQAYCSDHSINIIVLAQQIYLFLADKIGGER